MKNGKTNIAAPAIPLMIVWGLLAGAPAIAAPEDGPCSNRTLQGDYGAAVAGVLVIPGPIPLHLPFRAVTMNHFDGHGHATSVEHTVVNGVPLNPGTEWTPGTATYTVNPDCTGIILSSTPNSPDPLKLAIVVVKHGTEIRAVLDAHALGTVFVKVD